MLLGGGRALLLQLAHPSVAAGVDEHSDFRRRPVRRLLRTLDLSYRLAFGTVSEASTAARAINGAHRRVSGPGYSALDPDLLLWVHATLVDSAVLAYSTFVRPLSSMEREEYWQESKLIGSLLGIPRDRFPASWEDLQRYFAWMTVDGPVQPSAVSRELASLVLRPPVPWLPGFAAFPSRALTLGLLPRVVRERYGFRFGAASRAGFRMACAALPQVVRVAPSVLREVPAARAAR